LIEALCIVGREQSVCAVAFVLLWYYTMIVVRPYEELHTDVGSHQYGIARHLLRYLIPYPQYDDGTYGRGDECAQPAWVDEGEAEYSEQPSTYETTDKTYDEVYEATVTAFVSQLACYSAGENTNDNAND
jgi:hypothetical protein